MLDSSDVDVSSTDRDSDGTLRERGGFHVHGPITSRILSDPAMMEAVDQEVDIERSLGLDVHLTSGH